MGDEEESRLKIMGNLNEGGIYFACHVKVFVKILILLFSGIAA